MLEQMYSKIDDGDLTLVSSDKKELKCHKNILAAQSSYFEGMFEFNQGKAGQQNRVDVAVSADLLQAMLGFMYTSKVEISSDKLVDLLDMSVQFMLPKLKHSIELLLGNNLSVDNFYDTYCIAKAFECHVLKPLLFKFGNQNLLQLRQKQILVKLDLEDSTLI